jgi:NADH:ubiquinone oxidoreductase subunit 6 (subunit J)
MIYLSMGLILVFAVLAILLHDILLSVMSLAVVSTFLSMLFFQLDAPVAGVFELSVGAGLITVLVVLTISFIQQRKEILHKRTVLWSIFALILAAVAVFIFFLFTPAAFSSITTPSKWQDVGAILWRSRASDLLPQVLVILSAAFGILVLLRSKKGEAK